MNADWVVWTVGPGFGALVGSLIGGLLLLWWQRRHLGAERGAALPESNREAVEAAFATHTSAVAAQVSWFADELADGDVVLRERLRRLERLGGGHG